MKLNIVPARTGLAWVRLGIRTFLRQPLALTGLFFMYMAAAALLSAIPLAGLVLGLAIVPAATLGLMAATQQVEQGRFPMPTVLLSAFRAGRQRVRAMAVLGFAFAGCVLVISLLASLMVGTPGEAQKLTLEELVQTPAFQRSMIVSMVLYLPVSLAFWHAPALVHWHGVTPAKSLFFSLVACLRNAGAYTVFGLGWTGVILLAGLLLGLGRGISEGFATALMAPAMLLLAAMFTTSLYFTFRDSFVAHAPPGAGPDPTHHGDSA
jgi:hypothetical protein